MIPMLFMAAGLGLLLFSLGNSTGQRMGRRGLVRPRWPWALAGGLSLALALVAEAVSGLAWGPGRRYAAIAAIGFFLAGAVFLGVFSLFRLRLAGSKLELASPLGLRRVALADLVSVDPVPGLRFLRFRTRTGRSLYFPRDARGLDAVLDAIGLRLSGGGGSPFSRGGR